MGRSGACLSCSEYRWCYRLFLPLSINANTFRSCLGGLCIYLLESISCNATALYFAVVVKGDPFLPLFQVFVSI